MTNARYVLILALRETAHRMDSIVRNTGHTVVVLHQDGGRFCVEYLPSDRIVSPRKKWKEL